MLANYKDESLDIIVIQWWDHIVEVASEPEVYDAISAHFTLR